jgi:putative transcriptional regulator
MPILVTLDVMLAKRKTTLTELSEALDINLAPLSLLKTGKARGVRFSTLNAICQMLECQPGDLLQFVSEKEYKKLMGRDWVVEDE